MTLKLIIALLLFGFGAVAQEDLSYEKTTVAKLAAGKVMRTRAEITGTVTLVKHEADGDLHIRVSDGNAFIVAECMPEMKYVCPKPKVGQTVKVKGITRFDGQHKWNELHPVSELEIVK